MISDNWSGDINELMRLSNKTLSKDMPPLTLRTIRNYQQSGLLGRGIKRGKRAYFNKNDLQTLIEIKELTHRNWSFNQIRASQQAKQKMEAEKQKNKNVFDSKTRLKQNKEEDAQITHAQMVLQSMIEENKEHEINNDLGNNNFPLFYNHLSSAQCLSSYTDYGDYKNAFNNQIKSSLSSSMGLNNDFKNKNFLRSTQITQTEATKNIFKEMALEKAKKELDKKLNDMKTLNREINHLTHYIQEYSKK